jgi:hypothetical protein
MVQLNQLGGLTHFIENTTFCGQNNQSPQGSDRGGWLFRVRIPL